MFIPRLFCFLSVYKCYLNWSLRHSIYHLYDEKKTCFLFMWLVFYIRYFLDLIIRQ